MVWNERIRFLQLFRDETVDRPPLLEEGVREEVLDHWHAQGLPEGKSHLEVFGLTPHESLVPDLNCLPKYFGNVVALSGREYSRAFRASPDRLPRDWTRTTRRLKDRGHVACLWAYRGFFQALGVEDWPTMHAVIRAVVKDPVRVRSHLETYGEFCAGMLHLAMRDVDPDFIYLSEPISDNRGPLISPSMFDEFAIPAYRRIVTAAREHGCENILVSTYGNSAALFPSMFGAGITMLWISEAAEVPALDYRNLRRQYGARLGLIGGIPLSLLRTADRDQLPRRLQEIVSPLLRQGRYIPLAGGRVREEIPWNTYRCYREALASLLRH